MLWLQLALGLLTVPLSAYHMDGALFETLTSYVKGVVTFNGGAAALMADVPLTYKLHILLGFTIFLVSPFTRMIHIWSGVGALAYLFRPYQIVRTPQDAREGTDAVMSVSVNGVDDCGRGRSVQRTRGRARVAEATGGRGRHSRMAMRPKRQQIEQAIEKLLAREVMTPNPTEEECRRYYEQHPREFESGDLVHARHILVPGDTAVNVPEIRARAEQTLNELLREPERFAAVARRDVKLPVRPARGQSGADRPWRHGAGVREGDISVGANRPAAGVGQDPLRLSHRGDRPAHPGNGLPFEMVRDEIAERLRSAVEEKALRQYVSMLAGQATIEGADLAGSQSPLIQ